MGLKGGALSSKQQETQRVKKHRSTTSSQSIHLSTEPRTPRDGDEESKQPGETNADFEGVQRGDAEMGNKLCRVISTCVSMGQENPIVNIFNQGAGGNSHIMKMIVECGEAGSGNVERSER